MPPFQPLSLLHHLRYPSTLSLFGLTRSYSSSAPGKAQCTRFLPRNPSPAATRESPTPLVLIRAKGLPWIQEEEHEWTDWSGMFGEKGYTTVEIDISSTESGGSAESASNPLPSMASVLAGQIRLMAIPFPPVLIASGSSCLLAQQYIGDNPVSGLVMLDPPADEAPRGIKSGVGWPVFNYEPNFPILLMVDKAGLEGLRDRDRIARAVEDGVSRGGKGVSVAGILDGHRGDKTRTEVERWMDRCGY